MNVFIILIIYTVIFLALIGLLLYLRKFIFRYRLLKNFLSPSFYYIFIVYYTLLLIYLLTLLVDVTGTPSQLLFYQYFKIFLSIILAILSIVYGIIWLIDIVQTNRNYLKLNY